jgi:hypothetical protein
MEVVEDMGETREGSSCDFVAVVALAGFLFVGWELDRAEGRKPEEEGESFGSLVLFLGGRSLVCLLQGKGGRTALVGFFQGQGGRL